MLTPATQNVKGQVDTSLDTASFVSDAAVADREKSSRPSPLPRVSPVYGWYVIGLLTVVNVFNSMDRIALAVLATPIKAELHLSDSQLGVLLGFAFATFYAICGIPIARWADRSCRRNIIALALAIWSAMTALTGAAQSFWHLFGARVGVGAGEAGGLAPAHSILCDYVPLKRRPGVFALHSFGLTAGVMIGLILAGWLGNAIGWRWTFAALGIPGLILAGIVRLTLREPVRGRLDTPAEDTAQISLMKVLATFWRCRTYRFLTMFLVISAFAQYGLLQWWPSLYARTYSLSIASVGASLGLAYGIGSGIGVLAGGFLANRSAERDIRMPLQIGAAALALTLPAAAASVLASSLSMSVFFVAATQLFWGLLAGPVMATLYSVTLPKMRATAGAIMLFATAVFGGGLGPLCVGVLSDLLTPTFGANALKWALLMPLAFFPAMLALVYMAASTLPSDLQALDTAPPDPHDAKPGLRPVKT